MSMLFPNKRGTRTNSFSVFALFVMKIVTKEGAILPLLRGTPSILRLYAKVGIVRMVADVELARHSHCIRPKE